MGGDDELKQTEKPSKWLLFFADINETLLEIK
jgi:hypothetical protein